MTLPSEKSVATDPDLLTIGALAQACGVTVRTLRYYEEMDLIGPVKRSTGKYRLYNERSRKRVNAVLALQALGYSLEEILAMLGPHSEGLAYTKAQRIAATRKTLNRHRDLIDGRMVSLKALCRDIEERMNTLDSACEPCLVREPACHCHDGCEYRDIHLS